MCTFTSFFAAVTVSEFKTGIENQKLIFNNTKFIGGHFIIEVKKIHSNVVLTPSLNIVLSEVAFQWLETTNLKKEGCKGGVRVEGYGKTFAKHHILTYIGTYRCMHICNTHTYIPTY